MVTGAWSDPRAGAPAGTCSSARSGSRSTVTAAAVAHLVHERHLPVAALLLAHRGLDLLQGLGLALAREARLVGLVEGLQVGVGHHHLVVHLDLHEAFDGQAAALRLALGQPLGDELVEALGAELECLLAQLGELRARRAPRPRPR